MAATDLVLFFERIESLKCERNMVVPFLTELKKELWSVLQTSEQWDEVARADYRLDPKVQKYK